MTIYRWLTAALWLGIGAYWAVSAIGVKRNLGAGAAWKEFGLRLLVVALVLLVLAVPPVRISRKEDPELITSGPYAYARHPIYGGVILAMLGTTIGASVFFAVPLLLFSVYFVYAARREENIMITQFPEQYPAYMRRTWMLLPFVL